MAANVAANKRTDTKTWQYSPGTVAVLTRDRGSTHPGPWQQAPGTVAASTRDRGSTHPGPWQQAPGTVAASTRDRGSKHPEVWQHTSGSHQASDNFCTEGGSISWKTVQPNIFRMQNQIDFVSYLQKNPKTRNKIKKMK